MADPQYVQTVAQQIADGLAQQLGIATPPEAWRAFYAQVANETARGDPTTRGVVNNNPLNIRPRDEALYGPWPGQVGVDSGPGGPFAIFGSLQAGVTAAAINYSTPTYAGVQSAFVAGDPTALVQAIAASPWSAGGYANLAALMPAGTGSAVITSSSDCPPGWSRNIFGTCVPFAPGTAPQGPGDTAVKGAADLASGVTAGIQGGFASFGAQLDTMRRQAGLAALNVGTALVVIIVVLLLAGGGVRKILD